jgi:hypothetical protein
LTRFSDIASRFLEQLGYEPHPCESEEEARGRSVELIARRKWPCYFFTSDTTGEKDFEEFFTEHETLDVRRFKTLVAIQNAPAFDDAKLVHFLGQIHAMRARCQWTKGEIVDLFNAMIPEFKHLETGKYLDGRM